MITINLYDYKRIVRDVGIQKNLSMVVMVGFISLLLCACVWIFQILVISGLNGDLTELNTKIAAATPDYNAVVHMENQQKKYNEIITGINKLRQEQAPTTRLLEDVGQSIPEGVWLTSMTQLDLETVGGKRVPFLFIPYDEQGQFKAPPPNQKKEGPQDVFVEIKGSSENDQPIVHLLEQLRALPYIDAVVLNSSTREWIDNVPVQNFEIYCHFIKPEPATKG